jgi:hypothetical protein
MKKNMTDYAQTKAANGHLGIQLPISDLEQVFTYSGSDIASITVVYEGVTYVQTFTYVDGNLIVDSQWVPQP